MKLSGRWTAALAVWATLALGGCEATSGPPEPDPLPGPLIVLDHGLPGPVGFGGEIITWRPGSPPLALTLDGTTTAPPDTLRFGEAVERIALDVHR